MGDGLTVSRVNTDPAAANSTDPERWLSRLRREGHPTVVEVELNGTTYPVWRYRLPATALTNGDAVPTETQPATPSPPQSPIVVLVHGFRGDHHGLELIASQLPGVTLYLPDLPGFGAAPPFAGDAVHDLPAYANWLTGLVARLQTPGTPLVLVGHSFGSIIAAAAVAAGLHVDQLVLLNPIAAPALHGPRGALTRLAVAYYRLGAWLPERLGFAVLRSRIITRCSSIAMAKTRDRALRRFIHEQHHRYFGAFQRRDVVLQAFHASVTHNVSDFAERINAPTLLIAAERDDITAVPAQRDLCARIPQAQLAIIAGVGHLIHYETPGEAARLIRSTLDVCS